MTIVADDADQSWLSDITAENDDGPTSGEYDFGDEWEPEEPRRPRDRNGTEEAAKPSPFEWLSVESIFSETLPEAKWVVPGMEIGPGRPCGLWGLGGGGKSWDAMEIGRAVASGTKAFGHFEVTRGVVSHVSHELGKRAVRERYRRLANGNHMLLEDFEDRLRIACLPRMFLNSPGAEEEYVRQFDGTALVILDSLRRAVPGADENASEMSNYLDILNRVSERTGASFLVIHHCGKGEFEDKRLAGRGSTAIMDGSGCVWLLEGSGAGPRLMTQIRAHDDGDGECPPFYVAMDRVMEWDQAFQASKPPVRLSWEDQAEVSERLMKASVKAADKQRVQAERVIIDTVRSNPGITKSRLEEIVVAAKATTQRAFRTLIEDLVSRERLATTEGERNAIKYTLGAKWMDGFVG